MTIKPVYLDIFIKKYIVLHYFRMISKRFIYAVNFNFSSDELIAVSVEQSLTLIDTCGCISGKIMSYSGNIFNVSQYE